mgnify:CR=1 FL=1
MDEGEIYNVRDRPPRKFTMGEIGLPTNPLKFVDMTKLLMGPLAPVITTVLTGILRQEYIHGRPLSIIDEMVTMRDGAKTSLDIHFPKKVYRKRLKCPTILIRTPYWKQEMGMLYGSLFSQNGFVVVVQDIRGTGHSNKTGVNSFMILERDDAQDIINWIKKQFWYNGRIGTTGPSYLGMTQWTAYDLEDITCFNPQISSPRNIWIQHNGLDINETSMTLSRIHCDAVWFYDNPLDPVKEQMNYWRFTQKFLEDPAANMYNKKIGENTISFQLLEDATRDEMIARMKELYGVDFTAHEPDPHAYQRFVMELTWSHNVNRLYPWMTSNVGMDFSKIKSPFLVICGWQDMFIKINMMDFQSIMSECNEFVRKNTKFVIGPWAHGEINHPEIKMMDLFHGGFVDFLKNFANVDWFRYWLKDGDEGANKFERYGDRDRIEEEFINKPPLLMFTTGKNRWHWEHEWPLKRTIYKPLYMHSSGDANSLHGGGYCNFEPPADEEPDRYSFDPANPVLTRGGNNLNIGKGCFDQRDGEKRDDVLVYTSDVLKEGIEVTGDLKVILYVSSSAVDTDFMVKLCDVYPNGKSFNISDLGIRARYWKGVLEPPEPLQPGKVYQFEFTLWPTSHYFKPGHRIRIDITSSDFPKYNVNSNLGGIGEKGEYIIAKQVIYHDKSYPSHIILPVMPKEEK